MAVTMNIAVFLGCRHRGARSVVTSISTQNERGSSFLQWRTEGGGFGVLSSLTLKFQSFDEVEPDCKLSGKCCVPIPT